MIRHQITGARLRSRHFGGAEAKLRHLPTLHRLLQAVKAHVELLGVVKN